MCMDRCVCISGDFKGKIYGGYSCACARAYTHANGAMSPSSSTAAAASCAGCVMDKYMRGERARERERAHALAFTGV